MSSNPSKGRQSLPPMSANSLGTPTSARHSIGGGNGGSMILSSTRIKQPTTSNGSGNGGGLTSSRSMGNLRGSSEGLSSTPGGGKSNTKKKNKKGMKGWAWVVEDENGNIVDAPDLDVEEQPTPAPQQPTISREGEDDVTVMEESTGSGTGSGNGNTSSIHQLINQDDKPISRQSNNTTLQNDGDLYASSPLPSRASTATAEIIPSKRVRKSSSPLTAYTPRENNNVNNDGELIRLSTL